MESKIEELEEIIGYKFKDKSLLELALTHSSYSNDRKKGKMHNNERLEFLGDAVLELTSSEVLFHEYREKTEGELTRLRASLVCEPTLADCAREIHLGDYLLLSHGEDRTGGRNRDSVISDAFEALIGAIYLDGGYNSSASRRNSSTPEAVYNSPLCSPESDACPTAIAGAACSRSARSSCLAS